MQQAQTLLVESDDAIAERIERGMRSLSDRQRPSRVTRLDEAVVWLDWNPAAAILMNLELADGGAPESLQTVLTAAEGAPVIAMSANGDPSSVQAALDLGACDVMSTTELTEVDLRRIIGYAKAHAQETRLRDLEDEVARSRVLMSVAPTRSPDEPPLRQRDPKCFAALSEGYLDLLGEYLSYIVGGRRKPLDDIDELAERFVDRWASPWDLADVHTAALTDLTRGRAAERAQALIAESRLLALELMGELAAHYRSRAQVSNTQAGSTGDSTT